jgi:hypothetical protein
LSPSATSRSRCWGRQGNISAAPLPSRRASRQSSVGEQAGSAIAPGDEAALGSDVRARAGGACGHYPRDRPESPP